MFYRNVYSSDGSPKWVNYSYVGVHNFWDGNCLQDILQYNKLDQVKTRDGTIFPTDWNKTKLYEALYG